MAVELRAGSVVWAIGSSEFFNAFFATIAARLEPDGWGTRFPAVMKKLYAGEIGGEDAARALAELDQIRAELSELPPSDVVWDYEDRSRTPPWGDDIAPEITNLGNYWVTSDGKDLFEVLGEALGYAARSEFPLVVE
jgi:hypothetical protein